MDAASFTQNAMVLRDQNRSLLYLYLAFYGGR